MFRRAINQANFSYQSVSQKLGAQSYIVIFTEFSTIDLNSIFEGKCGQFINIHFEFCRLGKYGKNPIFKDLAEVEEYLKNFCPPKSRERREYVYILAIDLPANDVLKIIEAYKLEDHIKAAMDGCNLIYDSSLGKISEGTIVPNPHYVAHQPPHASP
jgi:hypothetical protein